MNKYFTKTLFLGKKIIFLPTCHSTNDTAAALLADSPPPEGTIVYTDHQTKGRGQRGNQWHSRPAQNITLSIILKPTFLLANQAFYLSMATALAIYQSLQQYVPNNQCHIKWPNDIITQNKKIAGILIENTLKGTQIAHSVVGIGLNINQVQFENQPQATSLKLLTGQQHQRMEIMQTLTHNLEKNYLQLKAGQFNAIRQAYLQPLYLKNQWHTYYTRPANTPLKAQIITVNQQGQLQLQSHRGHVHTFNQQEIQYPQLQ